VAQRALFRDDEDRAIFELLFGCVVERRGWVCYSACLMTTHYHLLVETVAADLAAGMHWLNALYAQSFNRRHGESGHVFDARYHSELVLTEAHFFATVRYIALNPVRAGLCERPKDWPWSSYGLAVGRRAARGPFALSAEALLRFGSDRSSALEGLRRLVEDGLEDADAQAA
jgi:REP element-mobilizing transposase RayT